MSVNKEFIDEETPQRADLYNSIHPLWQHSHLRTWFQFIKQSDSYSHLFQFHLLEQNFTSSGFWGFGDDRHEEVDGPGWPPFHLTASYRGARAVYSWVWWLSCRQLPVTDGVHSGHRARSCRLDRSCFWLSPIFQTLLSQRRLYRSQLLSPLFQGRSRARWGTINLCATCSPLTHRMGPCESISLSGFAHLIWPWWQCGPVFRASLPWVSRYLDTQPIQGPQRICAHPCLVLPKARDRCPTSDQRYLPELIERRWPTSLFVDWSQSLSLSKSAEVSWSHLTDSKPFSTLMRCCPPAVLSSVPLTKRGAWLWQWGV